jgi:cyclic pyranopterin phosphate synthase
MFSHLNDEGQPRMVDVGGKAATPRMAKARARLFLPLPIIPSLREGADLKGPKGPVFQTAIIAGVQGVKRTSDLIPMCHPLPIEHCDVRVQILSDTEVEVWCEVRTTYRTGIEMEALTGATVAALTVYDMCKALSTGIEIREVVLMEKHGGKRDHVRV